MPVHPLDLTVRCAVCGGKAARVQLVAPFERPSDWQQWTQEQQDRFERRRNEHDWWFILSGVAAGNGFGTAIDYEEAARFTAAFAQPLRYATVHTSGLFDNAGFCEDCDTPYCAEHWNLTGAGFGRCPAGHSKTLDPQAGDTRAARAAQAAFPTADGLQDHLEADHALTFEGIDTSDPRGLFMLHYLAHDHGDATHEH